MKKQLHILEGIMILVIIFLGFLLATKFIYQIQHENLDTKYMWDISFDNLLIKEESKGDITYTDDSLKLEVTLKEENEFSEFSIDIKNSGSLDALLDEAIIKIDNPDNILLSEISYIDGTSIAEGDILKSTTKETILIRIFYPKQPTKVYPAIKLTLSIKLKYIAQY